MELNWNFKSFEELSVTELYAILRLRNEVFVVEQNCVYQDADDIDKISFHITGWDEAALAAYCRVIPPGVAFNEASIGRVATLPAYRKTGSGKKLMNLGIGFTLKRFHCNKITISAQLYLQKFYESLGFVKISDTYLEDNIPHIKMQLTV